MAAQFQMFPSVTPRTTVRLFGMVLGSLTLFLFGACKSAPMPKGIETAKNFDLHKFEGIWYEIARSNMAEEAGLTQVTSQYRRAADGKWLINTRAWDGAHGVWLGSTRVSKTPTQGTPASFQLNHGNPRHVVIIDNEHTIALVCGKRYRDFWIISKSPVPDQTRLERLMMVALDAGFPVKGAFFVPTR
jgi:apolipoprotein D and lipocalin family protein